MNIHRLYYPVQTLGPGRRLGIWMRGCSKRCRGCLSPEMWDAVASCEWPLPLLLGTVDRILVSRPVDGVTISGGEPLQQKTELYALLHHLQAGGVEDILLYTGFTRTELGSELDQLLRYATVVLGPYDQREDDGGALRGSANQEIVYASPGMRDRYQPLLDGARTVQAVGGEHEVFMIGIPAPRP